MKKLLFSLVAAAACGAVTADNVPATATFDSLTADATFDVGKTEAQTVEIDGDNLGYWAVNVATDPELTVKTKSESDKYLSINTGSTPLWRTFTGIGVVDSAKAGTLPAGVSADGKVVSSDVKLTACTEWPTLTDFANEKLALFLFAKEEGDTSGKDSGLYAVGGAMVGDPAVLTPTAYRLDVNVDSITNADGWATVAIKTYGDIYAGENDEKLQGFVIAVGAPNSTLSAAVAVEADYAPGFVTSELTTAASTRIGNRTLIPATKVSDGAIAGLGFQGEGGIDNVNLFADDFATDAVAMTVVIPAGVDYEGITLGENGAYSFTSTDEVTITLDKADVAGKIVTVAYTDAGDDATATYDKDAGTITFTPVKDATLTITVEDAKFMVGETPYADFATALAAANGGTLKLLSAYDVGASSLNLATAGTYTLDLNGQVISGSNARGVITVAANVALTITNSNATVEGGIANTAGANGYAIANNNGTLLLQAGKYTGSIVGAATITGGRFSPKPGDTASIGDKQWSAADTYGYYTLEEKVVVPEDPVPSIPENDASGTTIKQNGDDYVVTPGTGVTEVTVNTNGFAGKIEIPVSVEKIIGVAAGQLKLMVEVRGEGDTVTKIDIAKAIKIEDDGTISLKGKDEYVDGVKIEPELATTAEDGETEIAPFVAGDEPAANVRTIPGLKYKLVYSDDLAADRAFIGTADEKVATGSRTELVDKNKSATKRFYRVKVSIK